MDFLAFNYCCNNLVNSVLQGQFCKLRKIIRKILKMHLQISESITYLSAIVLNIPF